MGNHFEEPVILVKAAWADTRSSRTFAPLRRELLADDEGARPLLLELGIPGRLLLSKDVNVLPLEDADAHEAAGPVADAEGNLRMDSAKVDARRKAMVDNLPIEGLALIVLGGSHDLGPHLPRDVLYVAVTPRSYPE